MYHFECFSTSVLRNIESPLEQITLSLNVFPIFGTGTVQPFGLLDGGIRASLVVVRFHLVPQPKAKLLQLCSLDDIVEFCVVGIPEIHRVCLR